MASFSKGSGRAARVEAIDLTLSSPEPEHRPRVPLQQKRLPTYFKSEPGHTPGPSSHLSRPSQLKSEGKTTRMPLSSSDTRTRSIDPQHVARIIESSSSQSVRDVLTDLCKLSPALCAAVARGLARHSTYAQGLIRHHQPTSRAPAFRVHAVKKEREENRDARERMKQRLEARRTASGPSLNRYHEPSASSSTHGTRPTGSQSVRKSSSAQPIRAAASQSVPRVKLESQRDLTDSDSDEDHYIPDHFPLSTKSVDPSQLSLRDEVRSNMTGLMPTSDSLSERPLRAPVIVQPPIGTETCLQCREFIEEEDEGGLCFYHEGPKLEINGKLICGGCKASWEASSSCALGTHVTADTGLSLPTPDQGNPSRSPSKRPRIS